jgi:hypothetical protein
MSPSTKATPRNPSDASGKPSSGLEYDCPAAFASTASATSVYRFANASKSPTRHVSTGSRPARANRPLAPGSEADRQPGSSAGGVDPHGARLNSPLTVHPNPQAMLKCSLSFPSQPDFSFAIRFFHGIFFCFRLPPDRGCQINVRSLRAAAIVPARAPKKHRGERRHGRSCSQSASTGQTGHRSTYSQSCSRVAILCLTFTEIVDPNSADTSSLCDSTATPDDGILPDTGISFAAKSSCAT